MKAITYNGYSYSGSYLGFVLGDLQLFFFLFPFTSFFSAVPELGAAEPVIESINVLFIGISVIYLLLSRQLQIALSGTHFFFLYIAFIAASTLWVYPAMKDTSSHFLLRTLFTILQTAVIVSVLVEQDRLFKAVKWQSIAIICFSFAFILFMPGRSTWELEGYVRTEGMFPSPNNLGQYCAFTLLMINFFEREKMKLPILLLLNAIVLYQLFKSDSMTSLIGFVVIACCVKWKQLLKPAFYLIIAAGLLVPVLHKIMPGAGSGRIEPLKRDLTFTGRTDVWDLMMHDVAVRNRVLAGFGYGGYWITDAENPYASFSELTWEPGQGHNGYIDVYVMGGIIGLILFLVFLIGFIRKIPAEAKIASLILLLILINNITESNFFRTKSIYFVLFMLCFWYYHRRKSVDQQSVE